MAAPTIIEVAKRLLRDIGVVSLDATSPANQVVPIEAGDLDDIAMVMTQGMQELWRLAPRETKQKPGSGYLRAPTGVTLTATIGSTTISAVTTWASWMEGCTIRIAGDEADNELLSSTLLARPYTGGSASGIGATVYADAYTLDETVEAVDDPVFVGGRMPIAKAQSMEEFMRLGQWPGLTDAHGVAIGYLGAFGLYVQKTSGPYPWAWFQDGYYDSSLTYLKKRIRFTPMPTAAMAFGFTKLTNPIRIVAADIEPTYTVSGGTLSPDVEGVYTYLADVYGYPAYHSGGAFFLYYSADQQSYVINTTLDEDGVTNGWLHSTPGTTIAGTYTDEGTATGGNATVTLTSGVGSTALPLTNEAVESLFLPICRQIITGLGQFKNEAAKPEIARAYKKALDLLENSTSDRSDIIASYPAAVINHRPFR